MIAWAGFKEPPNATGAAPSTGDVIYISGTASAEEIQKVAKALERIVLEGNRREELAELEEEEALKKQIRDKAERDMLTWYVPHREGPAPLRQRDRPEQKQGTYG